MLATEIFLQYSKRLPKKTKYQRRDIEEVFHGLADIDLLIDLLMELELLFEVKTATGVYYVLPGLLKDTMPEGQNPGG